jgi:hypothetical protein
VPCAAAGGRRREASPRVASRSLHNRSLGGGRGSFAAFPHLVPAAAVATAATNTPNSGCLFFVLLRRFNAGSARPTDREPWEEARRGAARGTGAATGGATATRAPSASRRGHRRSMEATTRRTRARATTPRRSREGGTPRPTRPRRTRPPPLPRRRRPRSRGSWTAGTRGLPTITTRWTRYACDYLVPGKS